VAFKVPPHLSQQFNALKTKEEKQEFIRSYKVWLDHPLTKSLLEDFEDRIDSLIKEDEETDYLSWFQCKHKTAANKGQRKLLRTIIKQLNPEVK
jgi:hypothetical protein